MSEEKEIIDKGDNCKIEFTRAGNIKIIGNCNGKEINNLEISILNKANRMIDEDNEI